MCAATFTLGVSSTWAANLKDNMIADLQFINNTFEAGYAPSDWKKEFAGWDKYEQLELAKNNVLNTDSVNLRDYQQIVKNYFDATKDYHVGYLFYRTESASLPFTVKGANGKYFIAYIDRQKLSTVDFPYNIGDEVVSFDGNPVAEIIKSLREVVGHNVDETDMSLAELMLTNRRAQKLHDIPRGIIDISIKPKGQDTTVDTQLIWDYKEEKITDNYKAKIKSFDKSYQPLVKANNSIGNLTILNRFMQANTGIEHLSQDMAGNPYGIGMRDSYLPELGAKIWESDNTDNFQAYIYKHENGKLIGYLRISAYMIGDYDGYSNEFAATMKKFEQVTDALVIDQLNNPGGSVFYAYGLASMLSDKQLSTPRHEMTLTQEDIASALQLLMATDGINSDQEAVEALGETITGYPVSLKTVKMARSYAQFLVDEWNQGKKITSPYFLFGVDKIQPSQKAHYTKPILMLVNDLDFSCGDFFPAILQDNKRATIMGVRTAGAGGYVRQVRYPNSFGLALFSYTASIAERTNNNRIENLGITPDVDLKITENDLQNNYVDYIKSVNNQLNKFFEDKNS